MLHLVRVAEKQPPADLFLLSLLYPVQIKTNLTYSITGIPTFRGAGGLWRKHKAMELATPEAFHENPSRVWQFYHYRREACVAYISYFCYLSVYLTDDGDICSAFKAQPNDAHRSLGLLTQPDVLLRVAPKCQSFQIITQESLYFRLRDTRSY